MFHNKKIMLTSRNFSICTLSLLKSNLRKLNFIKSYSAVTSYSSDCRSSVEEEAVWPIDDLRRFIIDTLSAVKCAKPDSEQLANVLIEGDHRGHYSHGLNRLEMYIEDMKAGTSISGCDPKIMKESVATASVNGINLLGPVVGNFCMKLAIKKARDVGVGLVVARGSNHYGIAGYYALQASNCGLIGISMSNTSPFVIPTRAKEALIGTNPMAVAAPGMNGDSFVLDMATSCAALGKVELAERKNQKIPPGWAADKEGNPTLDPTAAKNGALLPLGGFEETSSFKGYGLALFVELFCGILGGADYGPNIRKWKVTDIVANLGQMFLAVDPEFFSNNLSNNLQDLMNTLRSSERNANSIGPILIPGDKARKHIDLCTKLGGIPYSQVQIDFANNIAKKLSIKPPAVLIKKE